VLTLDQRGQEGLEKESFPLKRGVHPMVDLLLGKTTDERIEKYQRTILYLPLRTRDENMRILMVDNLLSQQEIPQAPAIIVSTEAADHDELQAFRAGANGYLIKPVSPLQLLTHVRLMLGEAQQ